MAKLFASHNNVRSLPCIPVSSSRASRLMTLSTLSIVIHSSGKVKDGNEFINDTDPDLYKASGIASCIIYDVYHQGYIYLSSFIYNLLSIYDASTISCRIYINSFLYYHVVRLDGS